MVTIKDKELLQLLLRDGWTIVGIKGSHYRLKKGNKMEVVPIHGKDMKIGLLKTIIKRTGLKDPFKEGRE